MDEKDVYWQLPKNDIHFTHKTLLMPKTIH